MNIGIKIKELASKENLEISELASRLGRKCSTRIVVGT